MPLDFHDAFRLPLRAKALALLCFARRAVTLSAVEAVVGVAVLAVRLLGVYVAEGSRIALRVIGSGERVQVLRVHAISAATSVVDHMAFWDLGSGEPHRYAVGLSAGASKREDSVAVSVFVPDPYKAVAYLLALGKEPLAFFWCPIAHGFSVPVSAAHVATSVSR